MPMTNTHELFSSFKGQVALAPVATAVADNTAQVTRIVDLRDVESALLVIVTGTLADADATFAVTMTAGNAVDSVSAPTTITDSAAADAVCVVGSLAGAGFTFADDNVIRSVGYSPRRGDGKRWLRATITPSANTGAAPMAAFWLLKALSAPTQ